MNSLGRDNLFVQKHVKSFVFDADVTRVFEDMIKRSVPGYGLSLQMISLIAAQYAQVGSRLYDLGCSLGASTLAMSHAVQGRGCVITGVDNSEAMLQACALNMQSSPTPVQLVLGNIEAVDIVDASVVVLNFTLQFIARDKRDALMQKIYAGMRPGGVLVLSEKVAFDDDFEQQAQIQLHESFKKAQGYSELEVSRKRQSIEHVLIPETIETHHQRLAEAGFAHSQTWFQCFNFVSMLAYK